MKRHPESLTRAQRRVLQSAVERTPITRNTNEAVDQRSSLGDRVADGVARFGGSRGFIIGFIAFLVSWVVLNVVLPGRKTFDPDPFTFLNLLLSTVAAIQAPIIKMARNRQARHDRVDAAHDHEVNPKAEIESMALHDKLDQPRNDQLVRRSWTGSRRWPRASAGWRVKGRVAMTGLRALDTNPRPAASFSASPLPLR